MLVEPDAARRDALDLLFDPQTSGGLLVAVPRERGPAMLSARGAAGDGAAAIIGEVAPTRPDGALIRVVATGT
jgi:selenide,water dikinase